MTLEGLKNYPNGVCLGYSSIEYLYKNKIEMLDSYTVNFMKNCDFTKFRLFPNLLYPFCMVVKTRFAAELKSKQRKVLKM